MRKKTMFFIVISSGIALAILLSIALFVQFQLSHVNREHTYYSEEPGLYLWFDQKQYRIIGNSKKTASLSESAGGREGACILWQEGSFFLGNEDGPLLTVLDDGRLVVKDSIAAASYIFFYQESGTDSSKNDNSPEPDRERAVIQRAVRHYYERLTETWLDLGEPDFGDVLVSDSTYGRSLTSYYQAVRNLTVFKMKYIPGELEPIGNMLRDPGIEIQFSSVCLSGNEAEVEAVIYVSDDEALSFCPLRITPGKTILSLQLQNDQWRVVTIICDQTEDDALTEISDYKTESMIGILIREKRLDLTEWDFDATDIRKWLMEEREGNRSEEESAS